MPAMDGEIIASDLEFPEGPVWVDGALVFTEIVGGAITRWTAAGGAERIATTGGGPNGATLGADGALYVTQNGGMTPARADHGRHPAGHAGRRRDDGDHRGRRPARSTVPTTWRSATTAGCGSPIPAARRPGRQRRPAGCSPSTRRPARAS